MDCVSTGPFCLPWSLVQHRTQEINIAPVWILCQGWGDGTKHTKTETMIFAFGDIWGSNLSSTTSKKDKLCHLMPFGQFRALLLPQSLTHQRAPQTNIAPACKCQHMTPTTSQVTNAPFGHVWVESVPHAPHDSKS